MRRLKGAYVKHPPPLSTETRAELLCFSLLGSCLSQQCHSPTTLTILSTPPVSQRRLTLSSWATTTTKLPTSTTRTSGSLMCPVSVSNFLSCVETPYPIRLAYCADNTRFSRFKQKHPAKFFPLWLSTSVKNSLCDRAGLINNRTTGLRNRKAWRCRIAS